MWERHDNAAADSVRTETVFSDVTQFLTTDSPSDAVLNAISSPCLIRITPRRRIGSGGKAPQILNAGWRWITHFLLHAGRFPGTHWTGVPLVTEQVWTLQWRPKFLRDCWLPPLRKWDLRSSRMLRSADRYLRMFRDNFSVPPSMVKQSTNAWPSQMGTIGCPETSVTNYQSRQRNIKEQQIFHQNSCPWCEMNPDSPCSQLTDESRCISQSILERRKLHRVTWALTNAWRGSEFVRKTYFALSKDRVSAARIIQSSAVALMTSTHTHDYVTPCTRKCVCVCVFVYVNMLLLPTGRKNGKVHTSHYGLCKKKKYDH